MTDNNSTAYAAPAPAPAQTSTLATVALVLGIISIFINPLLLVSIAAIVLGIIVLVRHLPGRTKGIIGIVLAAIGIIVGLIVWSALAAGFTKAVNSIDQQPNAAGAAAPSASNDPNGTLDTSMPTEDPQPAAEFDYKDAGITLTLKKTSQQCFDTAGCNVGVKVVMAVDDPTTIPADATGSVTYTISGDESGPVVGTIDLTGSSYSASQEELSTPNANTPTTVKITDITTDGTP